MGSFDISKQIILGPTLPKNEGFWDWQFQKLAVFFFKWVGNAMLVRSILLGLDKFSPTGQIYPKRLAFGLNVKQLKY